MSLIINGIIKVTGLIGAAVGTVTSSVIALFADGYTETPLQDENGDPINLE